jgi:hypothetical protein
MATKQRKRIFIAWLGNMTDRRDDEPLKIRAITKKDAREIAEDHCRNRFYVRFVMTWAEFRKWDGSWARLIGKWKPVS